MNTKSSIDRKIGFEFATQIANSIPFLDEYAKRFFLNEDDRKDLVSETILKALDKKELFRQGNIGEFKGWLITILKNSFINLYRKKERQATDNYDNEQMALISEIKRYSQDADSDSTYYELQELVKTSLKGADFRIFMAYVNGYAYEQIAEIMNMPIGTIKSKIHFSKNKIKANIKSLNYE